MSFIIAGLVLLAALFAGVWLDGSGRGGRQRLEAGDSFLERR